MRGPGSLAGAVSLLITIILVSSASSADDAFRVVVVVQEGYDGPYLQYQTDTILHQDDFLQIYMAGLPEGMTSCNLTILNGSFYEDNGYWREEGIGNSIQSFEPIDGIYAKPDEKDEDFAIVLTLRVYAANATEPFYTETHAISVVGEPVITEGRDLKEYLRDGGCILAFILIPVAAMAFAYLASRIKEIEGGGK